ncbi:hypothetical protein [Jeotgalibacillus proteolyticus]|uniref:Uncharacterized protein n=1 Tax=Jeotgalibacillus proteolyticus TaxID=2082395 RepID=A0A2S5G6P7_9BACL|nr:hypothetical protein [Jeotgalibacillus proteolyticus]PPA68656.1 hypothetical protein C4B60_20285 [Jeotgalibacillus proteolyticus]
MSGEINQIELKAKKYKKWREKIDVYPFPWVGSKDVYYNVVYKIKNDVKGVAVISKGEGSQSEFEDAFHHLFYFYGLLENIHASGSERARIAPEFYSEPLELMEKEQEEKLAPGKELISSLYQIQLDFTEAYEGFFDHLSHMREVTKKITTEDVEIARNASTRINLLQYLHIKEAVDHSATLNEWILNMKNLQLWDKLSKDQQIFYTNLAENKASLQASIDGLGIPQADTYEEMFKLSQEINLEKNEKEKQKQWNELRYP